MTQAKLVDVIRWDKKDGSKRHILGVFEHKSMRSNVTKAVNELVKEMIANFSWTEAEIRSWITVETKELNTIYWDDIAGDI